MNHDKYIGEKILTKKWFVKIKCLVVEKLIMDLKNNKF